MVAILAMRDGQLVQVVFDSLKGGGGGGDGGKALLLPSCATTASDHSGGERTTFVCMPLRSSQPTILVTICHDTPAPSGRRMCAIGFSMRVSTPVAGPTVFQILVV